MNNRSLLDDLFTFYLFLDRKSWIERVNEQSRLLQSSSVRKRISFQININYNTLKNFKVKIIDRLKNKDELGITNKFKNWKESLKGTKMIVLPLEERRKKLLMNFDLKDSNGNVLNTFNIKAGTDLTRKFLKFLDYIDILDGYYFKDGGDIIRLFIICDGIEIKRRKITQRNLFEFLFNELNVYLGDSKKEEFYEFLKENIEIIEELEKNSKKLKTEIIKIIEELNIKELALEDFKEDLLYHPLWLLRDSYKQFKKENINVKDITKWGNKFIKDCKNYLDFINKLKNDFFKFNKKNFKMFYIVGIYEDFIENYVLFADVPVSVNNRFLIKKSETKCLKKNFEYLRLGSLEQAIKEENQVTANKAGLKINHLSLFWRNRKIPFKKYIKKMYIFLKAFRYWFLYKHFPFDLSIPWKGISYHHEVSTGDREAIVVSDCLNIDKIQSSNEKGIIRTSEFFGRKNIEENCIQIYTTKDSLYDGINPSIDHCIWVRPSFSIILLYILTFVVIVGSFTRGIFFPLQIVNSSFPWGLLGIIFALSLTFNFNPFVYALTREWKLIDIVGATIYAITWITASFLIKQETKYFDLNIITIPYKIGLFLFISFSAVWSLKKLIDLINIMKNE